MEEMKLKTIFSRVLDLPIERITDELSYNTIKSWDSIGHMAIVAGIDDAFNIMLDTDDIINLNSVKKAKEILEKYGVIFNNEVTC